MINIKNSPYIGKNELVISKSKLWLYYNSIIKKSKLRFSKEIYSNMDLYFRLSYSIIKTTDVVFL